VVAAVATCIALLLVGMIKTWATRGNWLTAAIENLTVAGIGGAFAYGVGVLFDTILN
jgi:VIT1/CCC1 family predicted Fe2+/Mn2+ transporter